MKTPENDTIANYQRDPDVEKAIDDAIAPPPADAGAKARDVLNKRRTLRQKVKMLFIASLLLAGITVGAAGKYLWDNRIIDEEFLYGECHFNVGETPVEGRRMFMRPYQSILGFRWTVEEKLYQTILVNNDGLRDLLIITLTGDEFNTTIVNVDAGPSVEIPVGDSYIFVDGETAVRATFREFCN